MLRESVGYQTNGEDEIRTLCSAAEQFAELGVDGVVIGFLKDDRVDIELTLRILTSAPDLRATFHHAFEDARSQLEALREIKSLLQVDRILSSGGSGELEVRRLRLDAYERAAAPEVQIIAGGGMDMKAIGVLRRTTSIREFHVGRAAREGFRVAGAVQAELVRELVRATKQTL